MGKTALHALFKQKLSASGCFVRKTNNRSSVYHIYARRGAKSDKGLKA
jgi:hypothetical protein